MKRFGPHQSFNQSQPKFLQLKKNKLNSKKKLDGEIWFPQIIWSHPKEDYIFKLYMLDICSGAAPGTIFPVEKIKLNSKKLSAFSNFKRITSTFRKKILQKLFIIDKMQRNINSCRAKNLKSLCKSRFEARSCSLQSAISILMHLYVF